MGQSTAATRSPIAIVARTTRAELGDRIEVEWALSDEPGAEWSGTFELTSVGERTGPDEWRNGGVPEVVGPVVRWFVPSALLDDADAEVQARLAVANERCAP